MRFPGSLIFNGLQPLKMAVFPYTAHRLSKNCVFQQPANRVWWERSSQWLGRLYRSLYYLISSLVFCPVHELIRFLMNSSDIDQVTVEREQPCGDGQ